LVLVEKKNRVLFYVHKNIVVQILGEQLSRCGTIVNLKFAVLQVNHVSEFILPHGAVHRLELLELAAAYPGFVVRLKQLHVLLVEVRDADDRVIQICLGNLALRRQARESKCGRQIPTLRFDVLIGQLVLGDYFEGPLHKTT
jgi:hypothetical protein